MQDEDASYPVTSTTGARLTISRKELYCSRVADADVTTGQVFRIV
jgi:hypothetical protein